MVQNLLILHGWNSQLSRWQALAAELKKAGFEVFLPVLPGFKNGPKLKQAWELADYICWVEKLIKDQKIAQPIIIGHSFGGQLAAAVALHNQRQLKGLVLAGAAVIRGQRSFKTSFFYVLAKLGRVVCWLPPFCLLVKPLRRLLYKAAGEKDYYQAQGFLRPTMQNIINQDLTGQLHKITAPTLILWGEADRDTPLKQAKQLKQLISNSQLKIYPGRHGFIFDQSKKITADIIKFNQAL
ncbi:alpha/beta hydrolase [Patescibacteria group bacterium]|nr:alpha/beta hydrolase [Patescibacteria group bacterium]MBU1931758.1 alpha/beta hydrolase [Patescibacteria group bacterium]